MATFEKEKLFIDKDRFVKYLATTICTGGTTHWLCKPYCKSTVKPSGYMKVLYYKPL
jgi:hypothetical protein